MPPCLSEHRKHLLCLIFQNQTPLHTFWQRSLYTRHTTWTSATSAQFNLWFLPSARAYAKSISWSSPYQNSIILKLWFSLHTFPGKPRILNSSETLKNTFIFFSEEYQPWHLPNLIALHLKTIYWLHKLPLFQILNLYHLPLLRFILLSVWLSLLYPYSWTTMTVFSLLNLTEPLLRIQSPPWILAVVT